MSFNMANNEDQQLNNNMQLINYDLCLMLDNEEPGAVQPFGCNDCNGVNVLQELNTGVNDLSLGASAPIFEFHSFDCSKSVSMARRLFQMGAKKKPRSIAAGSGMYNLFARQVQYHQKENIMNKEECGATEKVREIDLFGDCFFSIERNPVRRLMMLFKSMHEHINAELPSNQLNSMPSHYIYDLPAKYSLPVGCNVRHHIQVLCTKLERFLGRLRRILETNRNFDYNRYNECDALLNNVQSGLLNLKDMTVLELRQRSMQFISKTALDNGEKLETLLIELRENLKAAHIYVHVFNWEMDLEYRYSSAMKASLDETNRRALEKAAAEAKSTLGYTEQYMIDNYQLGDVISCAEEHTDFLTALVQTPEHYFSPEIIALCEPPKTACYVKPVEDMNIGAAINYAPMNFIAELPPLSPPRVNRRSHVPHINRA